MKDELFSFPHSYLHYNPVVLLSHLKLEELEIENPIDSIYGECSHALHASTMGIYDEDRFEYLEKCVTIGEHVRIYSVSLDKYKRPIIELYKNNGKNVNEDMLTSGHAKHYLK
jgi:hypothetical protein